jgi:hypothetical protein
MILDFQAWRGRLPPCVTVNRMENTVNHPRIGFVLVLACRGEDVSSKKLKKSEGQQPIKNFSFVAAEVTRLKFPWKQSFVGSLLTSAATSSTGCQPDKNRCRKNNLLPFHDGVDV